MRSFNEIYQIACQHKGGEKALEELLPRAASANQLIKMDDSRFLSQMSLRIFRAGLKHSLVDAKWPAFEEVFKGFDPHYCAMLSDDDIDVLMEEKRIIRHLGKIRSVRANAAFIREQSQQSQGFGRFLADWPSSNIVELWLLLKKQGKQLGGNSGSYFLRMVGKDTFLLTRDVIAVLKLEGVLTKEPTAKRELVAAQEAFNQWQVESGRDLCEISRIVSCAAL